MMAVRTLYTKIFDILAQSLPNLGGTRGIVNGTQGLLILFLVAAQTCNHHRSRVATQTFLEYSCEFGVTEGYMSTFALRQRCYTVAEC